LIESSDSGVVNYWKDSRILRIIYDPEYEHERAGFIASYARAHDIIDGLEWRLAHGPTEGYKSATDGVWYFPALDYDPTPSIFYSFDDEIIYFLSVTVLHEGNGKSR
jgi:hypothetical protein